jgi:hypothetical protein
VRVGRDRPAASGAPSWARRSHLRLLALAFAFFNSIRIISYLPTIWAIHSSGESGQYSLLTWATWVGANASMAALLYENNGQRLGSASIVSAINALMCLATCLTIACYRP